MSDAAKYIRQVRSSLPGTRKQTAWIADQIRNSLGSEFSALSYAEIVDRLGTPETLAAEQIDAMPAVEIAEKVRLQNWLKKVILAVASAIVILMTGLIVAEYVDASKQVQGKLREEGIIIHYQIDETPAEQEGP